MGLTAKGNSLVLWPTWIDVLDSYSSSALQRAVRIAVLITSASRDTKCGKKELLLVKCMTHHLSSVSGTPTSCLCWFLPSPIPIVQHLQSIPELPGHPFLAPLAEHLLTCQTRASLAGGAGCIQDQLCYEAAQILCLDSELETLGNLTPLSVTQSTQLERDADFETAKNRM